MPPVELLASPLRAPILERLRNETRPQHEAIEANARFARLLAPDLAPGEYRLILRRLAGFHAALEPLLACALAEPPEPLALARRRKLPLLLADLASLGAGEAPIPRAPAPAALSPPEAWGALYVLEGATLGGRMILKHLQASLGVSPQRGASFYAGYGEETGAMWRTFRVSLAGACAAQPAWEDIVLSSAGATFAAMDAWVGA